MGSGASKSLISESSDQQFESLIPGQPIIFDNNTSTGESNSNNKRSKRNDREDAISNNSVENLISITEGSSHTITPGLISINEDNQGDLLMVNRMSSFDRSPGRNPLESFNFLQTEGQIRRENMADCEFECSKITKYLFVGGYHVAGNWDVLKENNIKRIVNCSSGIVENRFILEKDMKYLSLNMYDGRQDDISWFFCEVIQFIVKGRSLGENTLIHCEKGVSRSCSFAIAYRMWSTGCKWKEAFDYVKKKRKVCAPNTAFTCNIIEIGELLSNDLSTCNLVFRCSYHLPHDLITPVLKLCRNNETRKLIEPCTSMLNPKGVFVIRAITTVSEHADSQSVGRSNRESVLYMWEGNLSTDDTAMKAEELAKNFFGIITRAENVIKIRQGEETAAFLQFLINDGSYDENNITSVSKYDDYYDCRPNFEDDATINEIISFLPKSDSSVVEVPIQIKREDSEKGSIDLPPVSESDATSNKSKNSYITLPKLYDNSDSTSIPINVTFSAPNTERSDDTLNIQALSARRPDSSKGNEHISPRLRKSDLNLQLITNKQSPEVTSQPQNNENEKISQLRPSSSKTKLVPNMNISRVPSITRIMNGNEQDHSEERRLEGSPSQSNLGIAVNISLQRPPSSERRGTFKSPRVIPIIGDNQSNKINIDVATVKSDNKSVSDSMTATPTDSTHSRITSPAIFNSESQDINKDSIPFKLNPQIVKKSNNAPLALPIKLVGGRITPTTDKHPDHIGLSRGPTPVEDLTPGGSKIRRDLQHPSSRGATPVDDSIPIYSSRAIKDVEDIYSHNRKPKPVTLTKPSLFQAVPVNNPPSSLASVPYEWQAMGVYDDEDLNEASILLLLSPNQTHFLWLGRDIDMEEYGFEKDIVTGEMNIYKWASKVQHGEVKFEHTVGNYLQSNNLSIQRSGEENELFWTVFNEGF